MYWLIRDAKSRRLRLVRGTYCEACRCGTLALNGCLPPYSGVVGR